MEHAHAHDTHRSSRRRVAFSATLHCLTGCGIGEILGLVIADALGWSTVPAIALAVVLAFIFGYSLTLRPLFKAGVRSARRWGSPSPWTLSRSP